AEPAGIPDHVADLRDHVQGPVQGGSVEEHGDRDQVVPGLSARERPVHDPEAVVRSHPEPAEVQGRGGRERDAVQREPAQVAMDATSVATIEHGGRPLEGRSPRARLADPLFQWVLAGLATLVLLLIAFFFVFLFEKARPALAHQGLFSFIFTNDWNPARQIYGGWPLVFGTL